MSKKAFGPLAALISTSMIVLTIIAAAVKIGMAMSSASDYIACENSYGLNYHRTALERNNYKPQHPLLCYTQEIEFKEDGIYQSSASKKGKKPERVVTFDDEENVRSMLAKIGREIVEETYLCEKQFLFGKHTIFSKWDEGFWTSRENKSRCFRCARIRITDEFWKMWNKRAAENGVLKYIGVLEQVTSPAVFGTHVIPTRQTEKDNTYRHWTWSRSWNKDYFADEFKPGKEYLIIFQTKFNTGIFSFASNLISGDTPWYYINDFIVIDEKDEIDHCDGWA